jgi:superfamily I DNA/RNA helicase
MGQSYRCSPHVLASSLPLRERGGPLLHKSPFSFQPSEAAARVLLRGFWDSTEEGAWIAAQIRARVLRGQPLSSIAILVRSQEQVQAQG